MLMRIDVESHAELEPHRGRYLALDAAAPTPQAPPTRSLATVRLNYMLMRIDLESHAEPEPHRGRYLALDAAAPTP